MTRIEALERFLEQHKEEKEELTRSFWKELQEQTDELMIRIYRAFDEIRTKAEEKEKTDLTHFLFSLLRFDLLEGKARVRLDALDVEWYMDEEPLYAELDITFLFRPFFEWKKKLLLDMREYMGKVNKYDVEYMVQDEIMVCNQLITHLLRFAFRNIETYEEFNRILKLPFWVIRWGEYKDYSEIAVWVNREIRSEEEWLDRLYEYEENPRTLLSSYWYRGCYTQGDCSEKIMHFTVFEECCLKGIDFGKADLTGARFINCRLEGCRFNGAALDKAEFSGCVFEGNDFQEASMKQAVFTKEGLTADMFNEEQLEEILLDETA